MILVTGGAGFIGSRLCRALVQHCTDAVISLDDYSTGSRVNHVNGVDYREGRTRDIARLVPEGPEVIFHFGEYARVEASFEDEHLVTESNVIGTAAVLDYWTERRCRMVYAGSSTRFATDGSSSPYSRSKQANANLALALAKCHGLSAAVTYFYNVYGPGERAGRQGTLIEIFRQQSQRGEPLTVVAPGTQRRNFTHVNDIVDGLLLLVHDGDGEFPIGAAESFSPLDVAAMFGAPVIMLPTRIGNRQESTIDTSAIRALGWRQRRELCDYVAQFVCEAAA